MITEHSKYPLELIKPVDGRADCEKWLVSNNFVTRFMKVDDKECRVLTDFAAIYSELERQLHNANRSHDDFELTLFLVCLLYEQNSRIAMVFISGIVDPELKPEYRQAMRCLLNTYYEEELVLVPGYRQATEEELSKKRRRTLASSDDEDDESVNDRKSSRARRGSKRVKKSKKKATPVNYPKISSCFLKKRKAKGDAPTPKAKRKRRKLNDDDDDENQDVRTEAESNEVETLASSQASTVQKEPRLHVDSEKKTAEAIVTSESADKKIVHSAKKTEAIVTSENTDKNIISSPSNGKEPTNGAVCGSDGHKSTPRVKRKRRQLDESDDESE
eukprot:TRINITY_DN874_c0_g1_i2.p1 TRINITY_DN874_c0_g1~~TRINITY_DN874_c0_g1_i2.p1  ORF type:complete len:331 (-),score=78.37 TRINITY_DN874_c0_g1_i2:52-1044(-)